MAGGNYEAGSAYLTIYPKVDKNFKGDLQDEVEDGIRGADGAGAGGTLGGQFGGGFKGLAQAGIVAVGQLIADLVSSAAQQIAQLTGEAINNVDALTKFEKTMNFAGYSQDEIDATTAAMKEYADLTVFELEDVTRTTSQLAANGVKDYEQLTEAAGNLTAAAGGGADEFSSVALVMTQVNGAGRLMTQDWNQLMNAIPGASGRIQEALLANGAYVGDFREAMANGEITAEEFNAAIMDLGMEDVAVEAATSTDTFEGAMGQFKAAVVDSLMQIINAIGMENITGFITGLSNMIAPLISSLAPAFEWIGNGLQKLMEALGFIEPPASAFAGVLGDIHTAIEPIQAPVETVSGAVTGLSDAVSGMLSPAEDMAGAFYDVSDAIGPITAPVSELQSILQGLWDIISTAATGIWNLLQPVFSLLQGFVQTIWPAIQGALGFIGGALQFIGGVLDVVFAILQPIFEGVAWFFNNIIFPLVYPFFQKIGEALSTLGLDAGSLGDKLHGIADRIRAFFENFSLSAFVERVKGWVENIKSGIAAKWDAIKTKVTDTWNRIRDAIKRPIEAARDFVKNAIDKIKSFMHFEWHLPHLKLPHFKVVNWSWNPADWIDNPPSIGIDWYAKGGIFDKPTVAGLGEAGPEAIVPLQGDAMRPFAAQIAADMGGGGILAELQALRQDVRSMQLYLDGDAIVGGIAARMDTALGQRQLAAARGF